jgi:hypothetical protein
MTSITRVTRFLLAALLMVLSFTLMGAVSSPQDLTHEHELTAKLSGSSEVPGPGDLDGKGQANITLTMEGDVHLVCWNIHVKNITLPATAAHIHVGPEGVAGPVVVALSAPDARGNARGCREVTHVLHMELHMHPEQYYVNVHNVNFPAGAVRGQLFLDDD